MIRPSPAPRRRIRRWPVVLGAMLAMAAAVVAACVLWLPGYLQQRVHEAAVDRLQRLLQLPVRLESVELGLGHARLVGLHVGDDERPLVQVDDIAVAYSTDALWDRRVVVQDVVVTGGRVQGSADEFRRVARRIADREPSAAQPGGARIRLVPDRLRVVGIDLDVWADTETGRAVARGRLDATVQPRQRTADLELSSTTVDDGAGHVVVAGHVASSVVFEREANRPRFPVRVDFEGLGTQVTDRIAVAGTTGHVVVSDAAATRIDMNLAGGFSDRGDDGAERLWSVAGWLRRDLSQGRVRVSMADFELGRIPQVLQGLPLVDSEHATVGGRLALEIGAGIVRADGRLAIEGLGVDHPTLAREVVRGVGFDVTVAAELEPAARRLHVPYARIARDDVEVRVSGEFVHPRRREDRRYDVRITMPATPCQAVLDALPPQLVPALQGFSLSGELDADIRAHVAYEDLDALSLGGSFDIWRCRVVDAPADASADRLARSFVHMATMRDGRVRTVRLEPGSSSYAPLSTISPYMIAAVLSTEDGGFYRHRGFLPSQFETALRRNLAADQVRLGASTITMQMVKNVLLSHERTLSRKLQEMFLTWYLETQLSKDRIMEIYLNIVELGPGIYGVRRAADHYFGKHPADLDPAEAAYLALMLPSPVRRHAQYCRGEPTDAFRVKIARILGIMHARGRVDDLLYEVHREGGVLFDLSERGDPSACLAEIDHLMASMQGQRAVTGLLSGSAPRSVDAIDEQDVDAP